MLPRCGSLANLLQSGTFDRPCGQVKMLSMPDYICQRAVMIVPGPDADTPTVRVADAGDAAAIASIYSEHVRSGTATFDTEPRSETETAQKIADIQARGWPFLVATNGDQVVGYAYVTQFRDRAAYRFTCEDSVYVRSNQVGNGVGTILMHALIDASTRSGFRQMMAVIGGGAPGSVALHSKMGFVHAGRMRSVGRKFGHWLDTVYMQVELGEGDRTPPDEHMA